MNSAAQQTRAGVMNESESARAFKRRNGFRIVFVVFIVAILALSAVDLARAWNTKRLLSSAALEAARIIVSTPLASHTCADQTPDHPPCSIEAAADSIKTSLAKAGLAQASCITPSSPSFSGILVWIFSCDGSAACSTKNRAVCLKIDLTAVEVEQGSKLIPSTRVTVQYPHTWTVQKLYSAGPKPQPPGSIEGSALVRY